MRTLIASLLLLVVAPVAHGRVVVVATGTAQVQLIDTRTNAAAPIPVIAAVQAVAATPDGSRAVLATGRAVSVLDLNTRAVIGGTPLQGVPAALAVSPGRHARVRRAPERDRGHRPGDRAPHGRAPRCPARRSTSR